jgi:hypothetical protein
MQQKGLGPLELERGITGESDYGSVKLELAKLGTRQESVCGKS